MIKTPEGKDPACMLGHGRSNISMDITDMKFQIECYNDFCGMEMVDIEAQIGHIIAFLVNRVSSFTPETFWEFNIRITKDLFNEKKIIISSELLYSLFNSVHETMHFAIGDIIGDTSAYWDAKQVLIVGDLCIITIDYNTYI